MNRIFRLTLGVLLLSIASCIENNLPYPVVELAIEQIEGEGFTAAIDRLNRHVELRLDETTDISRVRITNVVLTPEAQPSQELVGTFDLRQPLVVSLSLYQEYRWTITAEQTIERYFTVEGQIGATEFDLENRIARAYVGLSTDLNAIVVKSLKLGPRDITTTDPAPEELTSFDPVRFVTVRYHDFSERWMLYVIQTEESVRLTQADAWSQVIWLYGSGTSGLEMGFRYRRKGDTAWSEVPDVSVTDGTFTACLRAEPETSYEVKAYCGEEESAVRNLRTEGTRQLPNSGFEQWCTLRDIIYPFAAEDADGGRFWGTGNPGASVASATLTEGSADTRPGSAGSLSARLESKFANVVGIGKFAAGNLFVGNYIRNAGTNGILTFGRPFVLRPTALRGWMKYTCGTIDRIGKVPAGTSLQTGDPDNGSIFIALGTWSPEEYGQCSAQESDPVRRQCGTAESPYCVDTRDEGTFFDPKGKDVVAYGELILTESRSEWNEFVIELDYVRTDVVPTHLLIVCSASRYGDYFTGSTKSVMYLDDFELLYDYDWRQ